MKKNCDYHNLQVILIHDLMSIVCQPTAIL